MLLSPLLPRILKSRELRPGEGASPTWEAADLRSRASHSLASAGPQAVAELRLSSGSSASPRRGFAGPRQRQRGPPRPPSPGNGRLEIGPQAEPRENGCDGQGPAKAHGRRRRVEPGRSRGTRGRVPTVRRRAARCLRSRNCLRDAAPLPPTRGRCGTLRTHAQPGGKRPQPRPCSPHTSPENPELCLGDQTASRQTPLRPLGLTLS